MKPVNKPSLFVFSGEHSGDMHASALLSLLKKEIPELSIAGVAGPMMRSLGVTPILNMEDFSVMGFTDVFKVLPRLIKQFCKVRDHILKTNPSVVLLVDYQEFNLRLAKSLRKNGYQGKIIQYIAPTVWAWRKGRAKTLSHSVDTLLTIFPFEEKHFDVKTLNVCYIGNPTKEKIANYSYNSNWKKELSLPEKPLISLFPGSRMSEIKHNLPLQLQVARELHKSHPEHLFVLSSTEERLHPLFKEAIAKTSLSLEKNIVIVPRHYNFELMKESALAIAKSGTVTLELALHKVPTVVTYEVSRSHEWICKYLLRLNLSHYCIVNILAEKQVFPEFLGAGLSSKEITAQANKLLTTDRKIVIERCEEVRQALTNKTPGSTAASLLYKELQL